MPFILFYFSARRNGNEIFNCLVVRQCNHGHIIIVSLLFLLQLIIKSDCFLAYSRTSVHEILFLLQSPNIHYPMDDIQRWTLQSVDPHKECYVCQRVTCLGVISKSHRQEIGAKFSLCLKPFENLMSILFIFEVGIILAKKNGGFGTPRNKI